jgi:hypothetical protein
MSRLVALATCRQIPELEPDDRLLLPAFAVHGLDGVPAVWDDPLVPWEEFELVLLRSTWDYAERRSEFLAWARSLPRVVNDVSLLEWNTDKQRYLTELDAAGVPIVPTRFIAPGEPFAAPAEPFVVKPSISAGGRSSARFEPGEDAEALIRRIHTGGRTAMVQPHLEGRETALVYIDGCFSHVFQRRAPLPHAREERVELYLAEELLGPLDPMPEDLKVAEAALACAPGEPLYARVDLLGGAVLELELTEPSLYFALSEASADRLARAVAATLAP